MDLDLQVDAFVEMAATRGIAWLENLRDNAALAVAAGDIEVTEIGFDGGTGRGARKFNAQNLLEVTHHALKRMRGTDDPLVVRADFGGSGRIVQT